MEKRVINTKLENLRNCVARIESKRPASSDLLEKDYDIQDIVSVNLERAIQSCLDIAAHIGADFDDVAGTSAAGAFQDLCKHGVISRELADDLSRAAGFRNLLVHRYASIDWGRVHQFIHSDLEILRRFAEAVAGYSQNN